MALRQIVFLLMLLFSVSNSNRETIHNQSQFFNLMKKSLKGKFIAGWDEKSICNNIGVGCDDQGYVVKIDISGWSLSGRLPEDVCSYLPKLQILRLGHNKFHGNFPGSITNCSFLEELNMTATYVTGILPDLSPLQTLRSLDLSHNLFTGDFPMSFTNLSNLEVLNFNENGGFNPWQLPENISWLTKLKSAILTTCKLRGRIPPTIGNMTSLVDLELSGNSLVGRIPAELGRLKNLELFELYYNQLDGEIPEELGNLTELRDFDASVNKLTGKIPESICLLLKLEVLQVYSNTLSGEFPAALANSTTLRILSLYSNYLTGEIPQKFGSASALVLLDLSDNQFSGELPPQLCKGGKLIYFLLLHNNFTGEIPESYGRCHTLIRFRVNNNRLEGNIPEGIFGLPHASIIDMSYNHLNGSIPRMIGNAKNLTELFIQDNSISGILPPEISRSINLVKVDLSNNLVSGPLPSEIGNLEKLSSLHLQNNNFSGPIPDSLGSCLSLSDINLARNSLKGPIPESLGTLTSLTSLNLSGNQLSGQIPESLSSLKLNLLDFSNNQLTGPIPESLSIEAYNNSFTGNHGLCSQNIKYFRHCSTEFGKSRDLHIFLLTLMAVSIVILISLPCFFYLKRSAKKDHERSLKENSWDLKSFHALSFTRDEILNAIKQGNLIGKGGSGNVYRVVLGNGKELAVKQIWNLSNSGWGKSHTTTPMLSKRGKRSKQFEAEVQTLGLIRHVNVVKLYCSITSEDSSLLVYEYLPNGSLWDRLHTCQVTALGWETRYEIALGAAKGLHYLHNGCNNPVIHRDVKSSNILLDEDFKPKIADFGLAKFVKPDFGKDSTHAIVGTHGYIAPEYGYTHRVDEKSDVYSFGVVLMELVSGKRPIELEYGDDNNIVDWVKSKLKDNDSALSIVDSSIQAPYKEDTIKLLKIAIACTARIPRLRPTMRKVVQMLENAEPRKVVEDYN